jgi:hypothetical protein
MLLNLLHTITDLVVFVMLLIVGDLADEQRMALIDQSILLQGFGGAFEFDLHDLLIILIALLGIIFWRAWDRSNRWTYRRFKSRA